MEIRNPKAEGRRKPEARSPKPEMALGADAARAGSLFGFRPSAFCRPSDFGLRISLPLLSLFLPTASFAAATNAPGEDALLKLRPPRGEIPPTFWERDGVWIIAAVVVLLVVIALGVWWLTRPKPTVPVPPDVQARKALEPLRQKAEDGAVLSQVSQILRHYVSAAFALPPGEMTTADFCRAIADQGRLGDDLSASLSDFLRKCDERKFAPPHPVAGGRLPAVEGGILPPGAAPESSIATAIATVIPPGKMPGSPAGKMPAATAQGGAPGLDAVTEAFKLIELAEARRAQLPPFEPARPAPQAPQAYRGASKG
jgi:hypothetical protein